MLTTHGWLIIAQKGKISDKIDLENKYHPHEKQRYNTVRNIMSGKERPEIPAD
jgi:hypothetical protein